MLIRYETFPPIGGSVNELFERPLTRLFSGWPYVAGMQRYPQVNVSEDHDEIHILAEIPGVRKDDIKLQLHDDTLTISGERKAPHPSKEYLRKEIAYGEFSRVINLPYPVDAPKVSAEFTNGVLRIVLPKQESAKPKDIAIR